MERVSFAKQGGPTAQSTLAFRASQRVVYRELTVRLIIVIVTGPESAQEARRNTGGPIDWRRQGAAPHLLALREQAPSWVPQEALQDSAGLPSRSHLLLSPGAQPHRFQSSFCEHRPSVSAIEFHEERRARVEQAPEVASWVAYDDRGCRRIWDGQTQSVAVVSSLEMVRTAVEALPTGSSWALSSLSRPDVIFTRSRCVAMSTCVFFLEPVTYSSRV